MISFKELLNSLNSSTEEFRSGVIWGNKNFRNIGDTIQSKIKISAPICSFRFGLRYNFSLMPDTLLHSLIAVISITAGLKGMLR